MIMECPPYNKPDAAAMTKPSSGESLEARGAAKPSLGEAWQRHMWGQSFAAEPHHLHRLGVCCYLFCLLAAPALFLAWVLPYLQLPDHLWWPAVLLTVFLVVENFLNYRACLVGHHDSNVVHCSHCQRTNPDVVAWQRESEATAGRHCVTCQMQTPPRTQHCRLCNLCVLRRHFHCYLLCCCIGHRTHAHFLVFCLYSALSLACGSLAFAVYAVGVGGWTALFLPVALLRWATGAAGAALPVIVATMYTQLLCMAAATIYGHLQLMLLLRNQTLGEMGSLDTSYRLGCYDNLRAALGPWRAWPMLLVYPVRPQLSSDGCSWQLRLKKT